MKVLANDIDNKVFVYDSMYRTIDQTTKSIILNLFPVSTSTELSHLSFFLFFAPLPVLSRLGNFFGLSFLPSFLYLQHKHYQVPKDVVGMCTPDKPFKEFEILCHQETWSAFCGRGPLHLVGYQTHLHIQSYVRMVVGLEFGRGRLPPSSLFLPSAMCASADPLGRGSGTLSIATPSLCSIHIQYTNHTPHTLHSNTKHFHTNVAVLEGNNRRIR